MCICARVSVDACVVGLRGTCPHWCLPLRNKETSRASLDLICRKRRNTPAKSLYLFNVAELNCGRRILVLAYHENVRCSCLGAASLLLLGAVLGYDLEEFESPFPFFFSPILILILAVQKKRILPRDSIISLQNSLGIIMTIKN